MSNFKKVSKEKNSSDSKETTHFSLLLEKRPQDDDRDQTDALERGQLQFARKEAAKILKIKKNWNWIYLFIFISIIAIILLIAIIIK